MIIGIIFKCSILYTGIYNICSRIGLTCKSLIAILVIGGEYSKIIIIITPEKRFRASVLF